MNSRYQVLAPIAEGGRGSVLRAWDGNLGREVALKRIKPGTGQAAQAAQAAIDELVREARTLSTLQHPNIVSVYDVGVDEEGAFIVMELVKGETLDDIIGRGALTERDFGSLVKQTLEGMIAAHSAGLIHLDLKPQNLMITWHASGTFQVKILDFGLATGALQAQQSTENQDSILGSIHFMAPEQFERAPVDVRTDLYAMGAIFYYALTQQYPFQGDTSPQVMTAHLYHKMVPLEELRPDLPAFIHQWVGWLQNRLPDDRPSSCAEALEAYRTKRLPGVEVATAVAVAVDEAPKIKKSLAPTGLIGDTGKVVAAAAPAGSPTLRAAGRTAPLPRPVRPPQKSGLPSWAYITIPALTIAVLGFGAMQYVRKKGEADRQRRFTDLVTDDKPEASDVDMRLLFDFLENRQSSAGAATALAKVVGGDYVDKMIVDQLDKAQDLFARVNLLKVIGMRTYRPAFPIVLAHAQDKSLEVRKAAWTALGIITPADKVTDLVDRLDDVGESEAPFAEQALVSSITSADNPAKAVGPVLVAYRSKLASEQKRALLLRVLSQSGSPEALAEMTAAIKDPSVALRNAALNSLAQWPNVAPLPTLAARLPAETEPGSRLLILMAARNLIGRPGTLSEEDRFLNARKMYEAAKDTREKSEALATLSRVIHPDAASFFDALGISEPKRQREAAAISKNIQDRLAKVVPVPDKATLTPEAADLTPGSALNVVSGLLVNWLNDGDSASWMLRFQAPGSYEISVLQSSESDQEGTYEVTIGDQKIVTKAVKTDSARDFKAFTVGTVNIAAPGTFKLRIEARHVPPNETLFRLKSIEIEKK
ncbi:MAG: protein kinase [Verrucomicrobiaceae bacterium]|nr:protein kinase [Verrucomicrobiaceae bacterium]